MREKVRNYTISLPHLSKHSRTSVNIPAPQQTLPHLSKHSRISANTPAPQQTLLHLNKHSRTPANTSATQKKLFYYFDKLPKISQYILKHVLQYELQ